MRPRPALNLSGVYLLMALLLLSALSLVALHPEKDAVLVIGVVMLTAGLAIWLPFVLLIPVVVAVWLIPAPVRGAVSRPDGVPGGYLAVLAGQLFLACASRVAYLLLRSQVRARAENSHPSMFSSSFMEGLSATQASPTADEVTQKPALPCGRVLGQADAAAFVERLAHLDKELEVNRELIRAAFRSSLS